jgi:hypothetical protein
MSTACGTVNVQPTSSAAAAVSPPVHTAPAVPHPRWYPLHKGYADLSTGGYMREDDDLVVTTPFPIVLRRTYNSFDGQSRQFGIGTTHLGEWWIYGDDDLRTLWGDLILPTGGRIHFVRISPGSTYEDAVLRHDTTPTEFNGALLRWNGSLWEMRLRDGSVASFTHCNRQHYIVSETLDGDTATPIVFDYRRDPVTNVLLETSMSCTGPSGPTRRRVPLGEADDKDSVIRESCLRQR